MSNRNGALEDDVLLIRKSKHGIEAIHMRKFRQEHASLIVYKNALYLPSEEAI